MEDRREKKVRPKDWEESFRYLNLEDMNHVS